MKCHLCNKVALLGSEPPTCLDCQRMFEDHLAIICEGCSTLYWLMKSPENIMQCAEMYKVSPDHIMMNNFVGTLTHCKHCMGIKAELTKTTTFH